MLTAAATLPRHSAAVSLRPAAEAYDYEHFRSRLAEPALLTDAVAVRVFRAPLLAVPVGGPRRGGYMSFDLLTHATETHSSSRRTPASRACAFDGRRTATPATPSSGATPHRIGGRTTRSSDASTATAKQR